MVDIALVLVGLWLLFSVVHGEIRRREIELGRERHRRRADEAREHAHAMRERLEEEDARGPGGGEDIADPRLAALPANPSGAEVAEFVAPRPPVDPGARLVSEVHDTVRERPEIAARAIRRMMAAEPEREPV